MHERLAHKRMLVKEYLKSTLEEAMVNEKFPVIDTHAE